uniref:hypothetical protein n=1 Tax=Nonomuraea sp. CA-252377 TaxID=3240003 RepID=UPI003F491163
MDAFDVLVTAWSNRDLEQAEFDRQVDMIRPLMTWDPATTSWHVRLSGARPEHVSNVLNTLFEAARVHGTTVTVQLAPAEPGTKPAG